MLDVENKNVVQRIESYCRTWRIWLENVDTGEIFIGNAIVNSTSEQQCTSLTDDIEIGAICAQSWQVNLSGTRYNSFIGNEFRMFFYLKDFVSTYMTYGDLARYKNDWLSLLNVSQIYELGEIFEGTKIEMGTFICVKSKKNGNVTELTLYDKLYYSDRLYKCKVNLPATSSDIENDICNQLGIPNGNSYTTSTKLKSKTNTRLYGKGGTRLRTANFDFKISNIPSGTTMRQMLSYIASSRGQFGYVDRFGRYVRKWYGNSVKTLDNNTIDLPTISERRNVIVGISCKIDNETTMNAGDVTGMTGRVIEFENPYMTTPLFNSLWHRVKGFSWYTTELYHRLGDPRFDIGDVVTYRSDDGNYYDIPITNLGFNFDGGLSADISAVGRSVEE